jgi:N-acyl-D-amino-acid deacylase
MTADIVLFDPVRVQDLATYEEPIRYPAGVHTVLVNGFVTVEAGQHTGVRAGRILRRPSSARKVRNFKWQTDNRRPARSKLGGK